jgi:hypothetical protein
MEHNTDGKAGLAVANGGSESNGSHGKRAECGNCGGFWKLDELRGYRDFWSRVEPGNEIPAGDCPECGAFAYLVKRHAKPARVIVTIRGGVVQSVQKPRGVRVVVKDYDNCDECGGVKCAGGFRSVEVHGRVTRH